MTTTVKIITHQWPVRLTLSDRYSSESPKSRSSSSGYIEEFVPAHSEREVHITDTRHVSIYELPEEATDLDHADRLRMGEGAIPTPIAG